MAVNPLQEISEITIGGESYFPTPHEVDPSFPEDWVWTQVPPDSDFISDPGWYDGLGRDLITQRRVWAVPTEQGQIDQFRQMLRERPDKGLDMLFAAAAKGSVGVVRFLLGEGVKGTAGREGDDETLVPLHAASYQGKLGCVKVLVEEGGVEVNAADDIGGTPLMRACWGKRPEVVRYLLEEAGADMMIRQIPAEEGELGTNALEFATGSGCVECAKLLLDHATRREMDVQSLITPVALAAGAQSDTVDIWKLLLEAGQYPVLESSEGSETDTCTLTDEMKEALEAAFAVPLRQGNVKSQRLLYSYLSSRSKDNDFNFSRLKGETLDAFIPCLLESAVRDDEAYQDAFEFTFDILFGENSRFTTPKMRADKADILNDAFLVAAQYGALKTLRLIGSRHETLNVNHLAGRVKPVGITALYTAAGSGHNDIVEYLFSEFGADLDVHNGNGRFANGPTAMWITVWNGHPETVKLLLQKGGGPVDHVDESARLADNGKKIVVTATKAYRFPVKIFSEKAWRDKHGELDEGIKKGGSKDEEGNEFNYVVLDMDVDNWKYLDRLQLRKDDEELIETEKHGRSLKEKPSEGNQQ